MDCIFCRIAKGEIKSNLIYQDDKAIAFPDINPKAPVHILVVPRKHIESLADVSEADAPLLGHLVTIVSRLAKEQRLAEGYRMIINCGPHGGQMVPHLHLHLLGGRQMGKLG